MERGGVFQGKLLRLIFAYRIGTLSIEDFGLSVTTHLSAFVSNGLEVGGHSRIRTYDFHRVKVALYR
jgi:hypothetical protein